MYDDIMHNGAVETMQIMGLFVNHLTKLKKINFIVTVIVT